MKTGNYPNAFKGWMDKLWLHPNWMLSSNKKEHITDKQNLDVPQDIVLMKKPISKGCVLDDSMYVRIMKWTICVEIENGVVDWWLPGDRGWGR